tara:strand:- start:1462 stop:1674 length:213 start_codon:yes stop_codon:yes gene_type:complete
MDSKFKSWNKYKYLTIDENGKSSVYTSLREISKNIDVDYTTISKKLKDSLENCVCTSKTTKKCYLIKKIA